METRAVRATVAAMLVAAGIIAGARVVAIDGRTTNALSRLQQLDGQLDEMLATVAAVRGAQQAYFQPAGDQPAGSRARFEQVRTLTETLERGLAAVRPLLEAPDQADTWTRLSTTLHDFAATDTRVRANIQNETYFSAADLVFSASAGMLGALTDDLRALEARVDDDRQTVIAAARRDGTLALGGTAAVWLVGLGLLVPTRRDRAIPGADAAASADADDSTTTTAGPGGDASATHAADPLPAPEFEPVQQPSAAPVAVPLPAVLAAPAGIADVAALCTDIARVGSAAELRELLARVAGTLHADGVIVWMGAGEELFAAIGHGYPPQMLRRLEPLRRDGRNAAAAAWRDATPQVVAGEGGQPGALVVPLMGVTGAVGALSCELADGREQDPALLSFAQLVAAQLSTVVAGWPAPSVGDGEEPEGGQADPLSNPLSTPLSDSLAARLAANQ